MRVSAPACKPSSLGIMVAFKKCHCSVSRNAPLVALEFFLPEYCDYQSVPKRKFDNGEEWDGRPSWTLDA